MPLGLDAPGSSSAGHYPLSKLSRCSLSISSLRLSVLLEMTDTLPTSPSARSSTIFAHSPRAAGSYHGSTLDINGDAEKTAAASVGDDPDDYPDGGLRAWLVVLGVSLDPLTFQREE